ncbi:MAG: methyl-accepting chemotaxis protein, partial [Pseudomonadota bacterium]
MIGALRGLRTAIRRIEAAEDDIAIPSLRRRDAIGEIARSLQSISSQGADAARVRAAVAASETPFLIVDAKGRSAFENAAFTRLFDARSADLGALLAPAEAGARDASRLLQAISEAETAGAKIKKSLGEDAVEIVVGQMILEARPSPVFDSAGAEIGATLQLADVTEVRRLEQNVVAVLQGVERGEFTERVRFVDDLGFTSVAAKGLNRQMDGIQAFMEALESSLAAMAQGDLTRRMDQPFEGDFERARESVNANLQELVAMVRAISGAALAVQRTAGPIASGARNLAQRAEEQAAALEEVNATMEEMSQSIARSADRAKSAAALAGAASDRATAGADVLEETRGAMGRIEESASKVVEIVSVIDSIAFQTNLLALNAAVEAARAGDAGKGFAVVASEVRTLAQRSSEAASEIRGLIKESSGNVEAGVELMGRTGGALDEIRG